jgi:streptogramin lyase
MHNGARIYRKDIHGMTDRPETTEIVEPTPVTLDTQPPTQPPRWRRLVRRDAGFGVLVLVALLVTVLVISRPPSSAPQSSITPRQGLGTSTPLTQSATIVQHANAEIIPMPSSRAGLMQPAVDAEGNIWVGEMVNNQLARIDPKTGQVTEWTPPNGKYNIMATAVDRQGAIWFTEQAANYIGRFDPTTQTFTIYSLDSAIGPRMAPQDLAFDADGKLWFTLLGGRIGRLDPTTGAMQSWHVPVPQGTSRAYPFSLAITPSGIWFGYLNGGTVGRLDPATGKVTLLPLANHQAAVYAMTADASGRVWFTEMQPAILGSIDPATDKVTELPVPHAAGDPSILYSLVTTGDGSVWFASAGANAVVHYQAKDDLFTFYQLPASQSVPFGMALGRTGSIWISGDGAADNYVARLTP